MVLLQAAVLVSLTLSMTNADYSFNCKDRNNQNVDWFVIYKQPRLTTATDPTVHNGTGFLYVDANSKTAWSLSDVGLDLPNQPMAYTLQPFYDRQGDTDLFHIMYNDEFPNSTIWTDDLGHTKGFAYFGSQQGIWMIHSVPKFPLNNTYIWSSNAYVYGQMALCLTLPYLHLADIAEQLFFTQPFIYSSRLPTAMATSMPRWGQVLSGQYQQGAPFYRIQSFLTTGRVQFTHYAKNQEFARDLYFDLVAQQLNTPLSVETWQHASDTSSNLHSWCNSSSQYQVYNVRTVTLPFNISYTNYYDHSKYAIATVPPPWQPTPWVCIGDTNRQTHQMVRGGGTMCTVSADLWKVFNASIGSVWACDEAKQMNRGLAMSLNSNAI